MSTENLPEQEKKLSWDSAIADAETEIRRSRQRIARLAKSIQLFRKRKAAADPWPGRQVENASK